MGSRSLVFFHIGPCAYFNLLELAQRLVVKEYELGAQLEANLGALGVFMLATPLISNLCLHIYGYAGKEDSHIMERKGCIVSLRCCSLII